MEKEEEIFEIIEEEEKEEEEEFRSTWRKGLRNWERKLTQILVLQKLQSNIFHSHQSLLFIVKGVTTLQNPPFSPLSRQSQGL